MLKQKRPILVFLMENKIRKNKMEVIQCKLNYTSMFVVDCVGRSGGMALLWGDEVFVEVQNFSQRHINGLVKIFEFAESWQFKGFYGHPDTSKRYEAWVLLKFLAQQLSAPWVCIGDFNEVVALSEIWGWQEMLPKSNVGFSTSFGE
jgi:hypothetical protein